MEQDSCQEGSGEYLHGSRDGVLRAAGLQGKLFVLPVAHDERSDSCSPW